MILFETIIILLFTTVHSTSNWNIHGLTIQLEDLDAGAGLIYGIVNERIEPHIDKRSVDQKNINLSPSLKQDMSSIMTENMNRESSKLDYEFPSYTATFRKELTMGKLFLTDGELLQSVTVNVGTNISCEYHDAQAVFLLAMPSMIPNVTFKYNYKLEMENGNITTGRIKIVFEDNDVVIGLAVLIKPEGGCIPNPFNLAYDKVLKNYRVYPTYYPDKRENLQPIQEKIFEAIMNSWLYNDYRDDMKTFIYNVLSESVKSTSNVIVKSEEFNQICRELKKEV